MNRLAVDPPCGVLDPKEGTFMAVFCDTFIYGQEDINNDRITIGWSNTPNGAAKTFRRECQVSEWKKIEMVCDDYDNDLDSVVFQHGHGFEQMIPDQNRNVRKRECKVARASLIIKYE
uniref:MSP domain-containing protein n=1 Tax=Rhabditophanes sp. KR3021 TaxID=114890 RepID=A0AC35TGI6_9BILA